MQVAKKSVRLQIVDALGSRCMWLGGCDVADPDMLQVEHKYGDGGKERRKFGNGYTHPTPPGYQAPRLGSTGFVKGYYEYILENVASGRYQLLCANHNAKKHAIERRCKKWEGEQPCPFAVMDGVVVHAS